MRELSPSYFRMICESEVSNQQSHAVQKPVEKYLPQKKINMNTKNACLEWKYKNFLK